MTDQEHADAIRSALRELRRSIIRAKADGLKVTIQRHDSPVPTFETSLIGDHGWRPNEIDGAIRIVRECAL